MTIHVESEADVMREVADILLRNLSPSRLARFWAGWQMGQGDYLQWRDETFEGLSVDDPYEATRAFQQEENPS